MANEWELSKENVQPLKQGRNFSSLSAALQPNTNDHLRKEKQEFEAELRTYSGDDPLDVWYRYVKWTEQSHPKGGKNSNLTPILERCLSHFKNDERYKNDPRYIEAWILYANLCIEPQDIFSFMYDQNVGRESAFFYEAWAWTFEQVGNTKRADSIFQEGLKLKAEPIDVLQRKHIEFQKRIARRLMTEQDDYTDSNMLAVSEDQRTALGHLKTTGKQNKVGVNRIGAAKQGSRGGLGLRMTTTTTTSSQVGQTFQVFNDENQDPSQLPTQKGQWSQTPQASVLNKENDQKPGVWTKAKVVQKGISVPIYQVNTHNKPSFAVHVEENADQSMMTPRKLPEVGNQVLSARKPEKTIDPLRHVREQEQNNPQLKPMYCKHLIYFGAEEYSFEELRAARWKAKKKKEEEHKKLEEEAKELEAQRESLRRTRELYLEQEEQFKQQQLKLKQEREAMIAQYHNQIKEQQEQFKKERQLQLQIQQEMLEKDINQRMLQQLSVSNNSEASPRENYSINSNKDVQSQSGALQFLHPNQSLNNSNRLSQSLNSSNRTPSCKGIMNDSQSSGKLSHPSTGPTPDSSYRRSLTAPSPTVCTKEAMQLVMGMFNASLDIEKHLGFGEVEAEMPSSTCNTADVKVEPVSNDIPFTIYDESSAPKQPSVPITNHCNKENDENRPPTEFPLAPRRKSLGGILKHGKTFEMDASGIAGNPVLAMDFQEDPENDKMEGIESQAADDFTIAPVGSHQSFAAAARFASTPFHPNISRGTLPDVSQINGLDHTDKENHGNLVDSKIQPSDNVSREQPRKSFYNSQENDVDNNLSPIMEGSNEDSSGHNTNAAASIFTNTQLSLHHSHKKTAENAHQHLDFREEDEENLPVLDHSTHVIDTTAYIPPDFDDKAEASIMIDPHNPFDDEQIEIFLSTLSHPLTSLTNYFVFDTNMDEVVEDSIATFGSDMYCVHKLIGKGGYAKVYKATSFELDCTAEIETEEKYLALKLQSPPSRWEFHICTEIQDRLTRLNDPVDVRPSMMSVDKAYIFEDTSCLAKKFHSKGTLLDLANMLISSKTCIQEWLATYITIELLHMVENLHKCQIIHGDIKPDNMMLLGLPCLENSIDPLKVFGGARRCLHLIDFGQSIDMTKYPPGTTFMAKVNTSDFQCIEMKTDRPWTYQTDLFGLAGTIHVLLFGQYMKVYQASGEWRMTSAVVRKWNVPLWKKLFYQLLNVPSCNDLPDVCALRREFESYFVQELLPSYLKGYCALEMKLPRQR